MTRLKVNLFGSFNVRLAEKDLTNDFRTVKERAMIAFLMVEGHVAHRREKLAELFWPERSESSARINLRQALYGLRSILEKEGQEKFIIGRDDAIQFNPSASYALDVNDFLTNYYKIFDHVHEAISTCSDCNSALLKAVEQYQGDFLESFSVDGVYQLQEWISFQREKHFQKYLISIQHLVDYQINQTNYEKAFHYANMQVNAAPLEEKGHRQMIGLLARMGRRAAAIEQFHVCRAMLEREFGVEPSENTQKLYEAILDGQDLNSVKIVQPAEYVPVSGRLPVSLTSFHGRETEIHELSACLRNKSCRLITLVGIGGIGKTRLALEVAERNSEEFNDEVYFIKLHDLLPTRSLAEIILNNLGIRISENIPSQGQLLNYLRNRTCLLLIDHFDDWLEAAAGLVEILQEAPGVKILLTSRERVNYQAACYFQVEGLPVPGKNESLMESSVVQLFLSRNQNRQAQPVNYQLNLDHVFDICKLLGGHPLAIELASVQARVTPLEEMISQLSNNLAFLHTDQADVPERHRDVELVIEKSWLNLSEREQHVLARATVFKGSFCLQAAAAVIGAEKKVMTHLVDCSMISPAGNERFSIHPIVETFVSGQLERNPALKKEAIKAHYRYYSGLLQKHAADFAQGRNLSVLVNRLMLSLPNIERAAENAAAAGELTLIDDILTPLMDFYDLSSRIQNALRTFEIMEESLLLLPEKTDTHRVLGRILGMKAWCNTRLGRVNEALECYSRALSFLSDPENEGARPFVFFGNGFLLRRIGRSVEARKRFVQVSKLARKYNDLVTASLADLLRVEIDIEEKRIEHPIEKLEEIYRSFEKIGNLRGMVRALTRMGDEACAIDECMRGKIFYLKALELIGDMNAPWATAVIYEKLGRVAMRVGAYQEAFARFTHSLDVFQEAGDQWHIVRTLTELGELALVDKQIESAGEAFNEALSYVSIISSKPSIIRIFVGIAGLYALSDERLMTAQVISWLLEDESVCLLAEKNLARLSRIIQIDLFQFRDPDIQTPPDAGVSPGDFVIREFSLWRQRVRGELLGK